MNATFKRRAKEWMDSFPVYLNDQEAYDAGIRFGQIYKTPEGYLKQMRLQGL